jgi:hypothetical protein
MSERVIEIWNDIQGFIAFNKFNEILLIWHDNIAMWWNLLKKDGVRLIFGHFNNCSSLCKLSIEVSVVRLRNLRDQSSSLFE